MQKVPIVWPTAVDFAIVLISLTYFFVPDPCLCVGKYSNSSEVCKMNSNQNVVGYRCIQKTVELKRAAVRWPTQPEADTL